jgi:SAM-dependent methyltransferase
MSITRRLKRRLSAGLDILVKLTLQPIRYRSPESGYDARAYWGDRLRKHGMYLRGVGKEGLSEERNLHDYQRSFSEFIDLLNRAGIDIRGKRVLEIGPGNGFWLERLHGDALSWDALDITDALFPPLMERFPEVRFHHLDICESRAPGEFDIVLMIEVVQHIVVSERLRSALANIRDAIAEGGVFILGPLFDRAGKKMFHVRHWSAGEILEQFPGYQAEVLGPFRGGKLLFLEKMGAGGGIRRDTSPRS